MYRNLLSNDLCITRYCYKLRKFSADITANSLHLSELLCHADTFYVLVWACFVYFYHCL